MFEIIADEKSLLANFVESKFNKKIIRPIIGSFADSESFVRIKEFGEISKKNIFIIQQFNFQRESNSKVDILNDQLFKFFLLCDFVKKLGAAKIFAFLPYLPYSRQDVVFSGKMDGSIDLIAKFFEAAHVDALFSFDLHEPKIKRKFDIDLEEVSMVNFWFDFLKKFKNDLEQSNKLNWCLVAPDEGRFSFIAKVAEMLDVGFAYIKKVRIAKDEAVAIELVGNVKDKIAIVLDDIIDTGKTACNASQLLLEKGAKRVFGCFTHCVITNGAIEKIKTSGYEKIFVTDTVVLNDDIINCEKINVLTVEKILFNCIETVWKNLK